MARVRTASGWIGAVESGAGALPVLLLHGVGSDKSAWTPQLAHFGTRRRAVAFDFPGYGESMALPGDEGAPHDLFAERVLAGMDALRIERAHVCGLSLGGVVAIALADRAPDRVASLVLASTFAQHPDGAIVLQRSLAASDDMPRLARARVPALLAPGAAPELAEALVNVMAAIDPAAFRIGARAVWPADQRERAARIAAPTLILCGAEDRITPPALSDQLGALIPHAAHVRIADAGHLPNLEQPAAFNAAVAAFLTNAERRAA